MLTPELTRRDAETHVPYSGGNSETYCPGSFQSSKKCIIKMRSIYDIMNLQHIVKRYFRTEYSSDDNWSQWQLEVDQW